METDVNMTEGEEYPVSKISIKIFIQLILIK